MQLVPFRREHMDSFRPGEVDRLALAGADQRALAVNWHGNAVSAIENGKVLGIAGIGHVADGVGCAWVFLTDEMRRRPFALHRLTKRGLDTAAGQLGLHKLEVFVLAGFAAGERWAGRLGFEVTERTRDYVTMARHY